MASTDTLAEQYAEQIGRVYPDLPLQSVELRKGGQYNDVLVVNGELLFRFPRVPAAVAPIEREAAVLSIIGPLLPLPVPKPLYVNALEQGVGAKFMGYPLLRGKPLWRNDLQTIRPPLPPVWPTTRERITERPLLLADASTAAGDGCRPPSAPSLDAPCYASYLMLRFLVLFSWEWTIVTLQCG